MVASVPAQVGAEDDNHSERPEGDSELSYSHPEHGGHFYWAYIHVECGQATGVHDVNGGCCLCVIQSRISLGRNLSNARV